MASNAPNLECRMYEARYPKVNTVVMIQVKNIEEDMGVYVSLLEYNNIEGMILFSELSRTRIRSVGSLMKVGRQEPVMVLRVDKDKGYIDLSKTRLNRYIIAACGERYSKSKLVHSILRHVAETTQHDLEDLYIHVGWPLYRKYGHAYEAFRLIVADPDTILNSLTRKVNEVGPNRKEVMTKLVPALTVEVKDALVENITKEVKDALIKNIKKHIALQTTIRAHIEMICFQFDGVLYIKEAMRKAEATGSDDFPVKMKLVVPPLYVLTTQTLDMEKGIMVLTNAIQACTEAIDSHKGKLVVKEAPRAVSELDENLRAQSMVNYLFKKKLHGWEKLVLTEPLVSSTSKASAKQTTHLTDLKKKKKKKSKPPI
ncbi:hypothetical protein MKX03_028723 [Papaver bracteatum]|nr:hypothetical protein MKX03_028723 [Papaver bracteatum]